MHHRVGHRRPQTRFEAEIHLVPGSFVDHGTSSIVDISVGKLRSVWHPGATLRISGARSRAGAVPIQVVDFVHPVLPRADRHTFRLSPPPHKPCANDRGKPTRPAVRRRQRLHETNAAPPASRSTGAPGTCCRHRRWRSTSSVLCATILRLRNGCPTHCFGMESPNPIRLDLSDAG